MHQLLFAHDHGSHWGWWPPNLNSGYGDDIDNMYMVIMYVVLAMFVLTEALLLYVCIRYHRREGRKASYSHGNNKAELIWTIVPGLMLFFLALYQTGTWNKIRQDFPSEKDAYVVQVFPQQFEWNFRFPGTDKEFGTDDDVATTENMFVPANRKVIVKMVSKDVIHSFFLPNFRLKQDVLPGMMTRAWFESDLIPCWNLESGQVEYLTEKEFDGKKVAIDGAGSPYSKKPFDWITPALARAKKLPKAFYYEPRPLVTEARIHSHGEIKTLPVKEAQYVLHFVDIACAELCGSGHYSMSGKLSILPADVLEVFQAGYAAKAKGEGYSRWTEVWDKHYKAFNILR